MGGFGPRVYDPNSGGGGGGGIQPSSSSIIYRITYPTANAEQSQLLPVGTRQIYIAPEKADAKMRISWNPGGTSDLNNDYRTVQVGNSYDRMDLELSNKTVYFSASKNNLIIEIEVWN